ncbi:MAG TPA: glycosyltransferase [Candidatus Binatia bacterium]|nr:glycosyltransferase [Candidatus Binatia bacterium]
MSARVFDDRIRVLRVIARLNVGGPALHTVLLTRHLPAERYDSRLVAGSPGPAEGDYLALRGISLDRLVRLPELGRELHGARDLTALVGLVRLMRELRPHLVHTHTAKAGALGRLAAIAARVPIVVHTFHGHVFEGYFSRRRTRVFLAIERILARRTDRILTVSESVRRQLLALGIGRPEQVRVVPLGLELDRFGAAARYRGELRRELAIPDDAPLVGIVARLAPIKAHEVFIAAAARIAQRLPSCRFAIVGDGERRGELECLVAARGLRDRVAFLGWRADLERIHGALDVAVLTSRNEGSPVALIEAMAAGVAVVATSVGGVPDLIEDGANGLLVEAGDDAAVAAAVVQLLGDSARRQALASAGRASVLERHSADRLVEDVDALYGELLNEALPRSHARRTRAVCVPAGAGSQCALSPLALREDV